MVLVTIEISKFINKNRPVSSIWALYCTVKLNIKIEIIDKYFSDLLIFRKYCLIFNFRKFIKFTIQKGVKRYFTDNYQVRPNAIYCIVHLSLLSRLLTKNDISIDKSRIIIFSLENTIFLYRPNDMNHLSNSAGVCK